MQTFLFTVVSHIRYETTKKSIPKTDVLLIDFFIGENMKLDFGTKPLIYPQPVLIISSYNQDGTANAMNAAWGSVCDYTKISIVLDKNHKTVQNIKEHKAFTVSIADVEHLKESDFFGITSGNKITDKVTKAGLTYSKSKNVDAPIINEYPLTMECKLISYDDTTECAVAEIVNTLVDDSILTNEKIDLSKFKPICYDCMNHDYIALGNKVGNAFSDGKSIEK